MRYDRGRGRPASSPPARWPSTASCTSRSGTPALAGSATGMPGDLAVAGGRAWCLPYSRLWALSPGPDAGPAWRGSSRAVPEPRPRAGRCGLRSPPSAHLLPQADAQGTAVGRHRCQAVTECDQIAERPPFTSGHIALPPAISLPNINVVPAEDSRCRQRADYLFGARRSPAGRASTGCLVGRLSLMTGCRRWRPGFPVPAVLGQLADPGGQVDARGLSHRGSRVGDGWPGRPALRGWSLRAWGRCGPGGSSPSPGS